MIVEAPGPEAEITPEQPAKKSGTTSVEIRKIWRIEGYFIVLVTLETSILDLLVATYY